MDRPLPFFNWSLTKTLSFETESFARARIRIVFVILLISILKALVVIGFSVENGQLRQVVRAAVAVLCYVAVLKVLLYRPRYVTLLTHLMLMLGTAIVWTNIFAYAHHINLVTLQFVFMIVLSSFYVLGGAYGILYSCISILPVIVSIVFRGDMNLFVINAPQEFSGVGYELVVVLNFITVVLVHYLFYRASDQNLQDKERLNLELQQSIAEARKLAQTKSNFLSTMSHELRTPLNSVVGIAEVLLDDNPEERQKENLKILHHSALDLLSLINDVLDLNKIDAARQTLSKVPFRLAEFMRNITSVLRIKAKDKKLELLLEIDERLEDTDIISDPTRLSQIIYNLAGNSIKFTETGFIKVELTLAGETEQYVDVLFSITDTGIGIAAEKHESIFEPFSQVDPHSIGKYGGTGLGLPIVRELLSLFGGTVQLESSPGKGTRFFFTISLAKSAGVAPAVNVPTVPGGDFSQLKILIAEDNDINRKILDMQLTRLGVKPVMAEDGKQAFEAFCAGHFDAVFIDLHMPVQDGYETIRQIRALPDALKAKTHVIAFTAAVTEQEKIAEAGFDDYLYKPTKLDELRTKLEEIAAGKQ